MSLKFNFTNQDLKKAYGEARVQERQRQDLIYANHSNDWKDRIGVQLQKVMSNIQLQNAARLQEDPRAFYYKFHLPSLMRDTPEDLYEKMMHRFIHDFNEANGPEFTAEENEITEEDSSFYCTASPIFRGKRAIGVLWCLPREQK